MNLEYEKWGRFHIPLIWQSSTITQHIYIVKCRTNYKDFVDLDYEMYYHFITWIGGFEVAHNFQSPLETDLGKALYEII